MSKLCTSIEQSKKLIELGVNVNTADMCYRIVAYNPNNTHVYQPYCFVGTLESDIPAWSLSALFDLFPNGSILRKSDKGKYFMFGNMFDNPLDAVFEMVCWLKENNKI